MNRNFTSLLSGKALVVLLALHSCVGTVSAQNPNQPPRPSLPPIPINGDTTHTLSRYFIPVTGGKKTPNEKGFIQR